MYIPFLYRLEDFEAVFAFMQAHNFALVVSQDGDRPIATHLPVSVSLQGEQVVLRGHFAKPNPQWKSLVGQQAMIVFSGPHAYISPTHYERRESVPTWNYIAVHAYGKPELVTYDEQPERLQAMIDELIGFHEQTYQAQWDDLSDRYREGMLRGVVGFEMVVTELEGKAKLSQNKHVAEQESIVAELLNHADGSAQALGKAMQVRLVESE